MNTTVQTCAYMISNAKNIVVLTGAGVSTESGIRDFRSRAGLYKLAPEHILSLDYFYENPDAFYKFAIEHLYHPAAKPNKGHEILAKWEDAGRVKQIITQNIDGLHQKAGSRKVIEFHGTIKAALCLNCGHQYTTEDMIKKMGQTNTYYICDNCDSRSEAVRYIKPEVVLFGDTGEWFTEEGFESILTTIENADCLLVLGTSLKVSPFSLFPQYKRPDVPMIIVNKGDTPYDFAIDSYVIHDSIGKTLIQMDSHL